MNLTQMFPRLLSRIQCLSLPVSLLDSLSETLSVLSLEDGSPFSEMPFDSYPPRSAPSRSLPFIGKSSNQKSTNWKNFKLIPAQEKSIISVNGKLGIKLRKLLTSNEPDFGNVYASSPQI